MNKQGLLVEPEFFNPDKYLQSGERTEVTNEIKRISQTVPVGTDGMVVRHLLVLMNKYTQRLQNARDPRKFTRTANEILLSHERTGCCDSSTLFTALARSRGIPAMQIITLSKKWGNRIDQGENIATVGHYFTGCYLKHKSGKADWILIDSDQSVKDIQDVQFYPLDVKNRNMIRDLYAFAYVRDYSDITYKGKKIDSVPNMNEIQLAAYRECDKNDFVEERGEER